MRVWQFDPAQMTPYYNYALCDALSAAGAEVTYFTSRYIYDDVIVPNTFATEYLYFRGLNNELVKKTPRLRKLLRGASYPLGHLEAVQKAKQTHPDIVHLQWSRLPRFDRPFINAMRAQGAKIVHTVHDIVPLFEHPEAANAIGEIYGMCDALIIHAEANRRELMSTFPALDPARIFVLPHVSLQKMFPHPESSTKQEARRYLTSRLSLPDSAILFVLFGNLKGYKGIDLLLEAFEQAASQAPNIHVLLAGKLDDSLKIEFKIAEQVHMLPGYIPTAEIWRVLLGADVAVFPYRQITQSGALITAMGYGLPVIATNVGALPETVDGNGWVVTPTADALAAAMIDAVQQPNKLPTMGLRSQELIQARHAPNIVGRRLMNIYRELGVDS